MRTLIPLITLMVPLNLLALSSAAVASGPALMPETIPQYGVALDVPDGWFPDTVPSSAAAAHVVAFFHSPIEHDGFVANINLLIGKLGPAETLRQWILGSTTAEYLRLGTLSSVTIHGAPAFRYESTKLITVPGHHLLSLEYAFARGLRVYLFTYTALATDKAKYEGTFDGSGKTIRFVAIPSSH